MKTILKGEASKTSLLYFMGGFHYRQTSETMGAPETEGSKLLIRFKMSLLWPFVSPLFCFRESNNQLGFPESCWDSKFSQKSASSTSAQSSLIFRRRRRWQGSIGWLCRVFTWNYDILFEIMTFHLNILYFNDTVSIRPQGKLYIRIRNSNDVFTTWGLLLNSLAPRKRILVSRKLS